MKLFIGCCNSQEFVPSAFHWSWERMAKPYEYVKCRYDHSDDITRNNSMIADFIKSDCDVMVKMDIDQEYPPHFLEFLVRYAESYKVIGPLIHNKWRWANYIPLMFEKNEFPLLGRPITDFQTGGIIKIKYPHTNLFYMREVLEKIPPPWYEVHHNPDGTKRINDVDFTFLDKIHKAGYDIYIDTTVVVKHLVMEGIDTKMHNRWNKL